MGLELIESGVRMPLDKIYETAQKVRETTGDVGLDDLARSMREVGQVHAISLLKEVVDSHVQHELINGHRRFAAARKHGFPQLRANIYKVPDGQDEQRELLIAQHLHAANLSEALLPIERARQFDRVLTEFGVDIEQLPEIFKGETVDSVKQAIDLLSIDEDVLTLITANPERFTEGHLRVLADYASPSRKGAWRMRPEEQRAAARLLLEQADKAVVADPRKFDAHIRSVVAKRRAEEGKKKAAARRSVPDPVKTVFRALEGLEGAVKILREVDLSAISEIDPADKGTAIKRIYDSVEALTAFADERVARLAVRHKAAS